MILSPPDRIAKYTDFGWWGHRTVDQVFREAVATAGSQIALIDPPNREELVGGTPQRLTFSMLDNAVDGLAAQLLGIGSRKDDVLAVQLPNIVESVVAFLACARLGLIFCPISVQFREHELEYMLRKSGARTAIMVERVRSAGLVDRFRVLQKLVSSLEYLLVVGADYPLRFKTIGKNPAAVDVSTLDDYLRCHSIDANDTLTLCWTSGTEARPKGVPRHHNHWIANGEACTEIAKMLPGEAILNPFPMINVASIGGMVMPWLMNHGRLVQHHPFDLHIFLSQLSEEKIVYTVAPPAILTLLLKSEDILKSVDWSALRTVGSGSAPLAPWMLEGWQTRFNISVVNIFGSNEGCALFSTGEDVPDPIDRAQFFPRFGVPGIEWSSRFARKVRTRLADIESGDEITTPHCAGELLIDGALRFDGYWDDPELNSRAFDVDGYFRTGDLFEIAGEGSLGRFYRFLGRAKDLIVRGGIKISPAELDSLIEGHPDIREAAFCAVYDEVLGERIGIVAVARPGHSLSLTSIIDFLLQREVAKFKLPEQLREVSELPRNALGKVLRRDLPALFEKHLNA